MAAIRQLTWQVNVDALRTESLLQSSVSALRHIVRLIEGIGGLLGNEQANQTLAQMEAKLTVELIKLRTQTAAAHRAQAFDRLRQPLIEQSLSNINDAIMEDYPQR